MLERKKKLAPPKKSPSCLRARSEKKSEVASLRGAEALGLGRELMVGGCAKAIGIVVEKAAPVRACAIGLSCRGQRLSRGEKSRLSSLTVPGDVGAKFPQVINLQARQAHRINSSKLQWKGFIRACTQNVIDFDICEI